MDTSNMGAWDLSMLGNAIGQYVDRELNKPTAIASSQNYGIDERGNLYTLGQPAGQVVATTSNGKPANTTMLLLILGVAFLAMKH